MDIGSLFLICALLILTGLFVSQPFFEKKTTFVTRDEHDLSSLLAEKERTLTALQELDFDAALGKVPEEEYPEQRALLLRRGVEILQHLDALQGEVAFESAENRLEAAVERRRTSEVAVSPVAIDGAHPDDPLEALIAARRRTRQGKAAGFCPKCGRPLQQSDRFCPKCGTAVNVEHPEGKRE
jgi:NADH pyrophosphatase NudC (nudix superfamily)